LNNATLTDYCAATAGCGQWFLPVWFVGIEEASGKSKEAVHGHEQGGGGRE
jgi:hypothetical protein